MSQIVTSTLQRIFFRRTVRGGRTGRVSTPGTRDLRSQRPDFADTRPVVFRSEAFAEDLVLTHGAV